MHCFTLKDETKIQKRVKHGKFTYVKHIMKVFNYLFFCHTKHENKAMTFSKVIR